LKRVNEEALGTRRRLAELRAKIDRDASQYGIEVIEQRHAQDGVRE